MSDTDAEYRDNEDFDEVDMWHDCPNCGKPYDEIDYEYQICHYCKFNANSTN